MTKRMLIDAAHAEETRVVVVDGTRIEDFDFESRSRKQLRGNIYLAKVTRVEPSLQAAFVDYGGNRHGFLAFNEIHPDYYQIPLADREALLREEAEESDEAPAARAADDDADEDESDDDVMGEEAARRRRRAVRRYKIQEVIKRRQIMLVQVVKEERGTKGAALTTYLSLAGRYGVLMPNTARGGGVSRKITTATDRKRLKNLVAELGVPHGMGLIVRTAGAKRTKAELKRDYEYLMRLWEDIRDKTLHSIAPALIYEEEDLVKRAIRDMFDKDVEGVWVEGDASFREARDFMRMLMPSQAKKIQHYAEPTPLFAHAKVEEHLAQIYSPVVPLKSGGYLVINQTEALVAVDVNSGRSTRERNIEATALKTNLEAADEAARQLRLRDLAGLIVIDFIDMDESKNNRAVEKRLKDSLADDRARVQMGKISSFGLMEISRQRRRSGVLEGTTHVCEHCQGTGRVRSTESSALDALRGVEMEAVRTGGGAITLRAPTAVALYLLNEKRAYLERVRVVHGLDVTVVVDDSLGHAPYALDRTETRDHDTAQVAAPPAGRLEMIPGDDFDDEDELEAEIEAEDVDDDEPTARLEQQEREDDDGQRRSRRRRRRRGGRRDEAPVSVGDAGAANDIGEDAESGAAPTAAEVRDAGDPLGQKRRRRGRRGGRRMRDEAGGDEPYVWHRPRVPEGDPYIWMEPGLAPAPHAPPVLAEAAPVIETAEAAPVIEAAEAAVETAMVAEVDAPDLDVWVELPAEPEPKAKAPRARRSRAKAAASEPAAEAEVATEGAAAPAPVAEPEPTAEPAHDPEPQLEPVGALTEPEPVAAFVEPAEPDAAEISSPPAQPKRGWWRRSG
ncbi:MAG TPA: ribonuclease E/G [Caulobacteraceae bacterium]|nr:ribonuclease E/G [Caulobacteraceae bacterium]